MVAGNTSDSQIEIPLSTSGQNVVVIGAGFAGLSAACSLAKEGFKVTVLDKLPEVHQATDDSDFLFQKLSVQHHERIRGWICVRHSAWPQN
jgi:2-polyprenyl-6-methoxyphenol hydroxylase-like FAD-dependent oxidoreductase